MDELEVYYREPVGKYSNFTELFIPLYPHPESRFYKLTYCLKLCFDGFEIDKKYLRVDYCYANFENLVDAYPSLTNLILPKLEILNLVNKYREYYEHQLKEIDNCIKFIKDEEIEE